MLNDSTRLKPDRVTSNRGLPIRNETAHRGYLVFGVEIDLNELICAGFGIAAVPAV